MVSNTRPAPHWIEVTTLSDPRPRYVMGYEPPPAPPMHAPLAPSKCPSCGSREWVERDGREVCAYCRSKR